MVCGLALGRAGRVIFQSLGPAPREWGGRHSSFRAPYPKCSSDLCPIPLLYEPVSSRDLSAAFSAANQSVPQLKWTPRHIACSLWTINRPKTTFVDLIAPLRFSRLQRTAVAAYFLAIAYCCV